MEKLTFKDIQQSKEFQEGLKEFEEKRVKKPESKKYRWYKKIVSGQEWKDKYKDSGFTILDMKREGNSIIEVEFGFLSIIEPEGCLEITNDDDLLKIDNHRRAINQRPFVTEDVDNRKIKEEIDISEIEF